MSSNEGKSCNCLRGSQVVYVVKIFNVCNAIFLCFAGVWAFLSITLNLPVILSAIYVIAFSTLLCCFEVHLQRFATVVQQNFGFMFSNCGRCVFFVFVGTLAFGLGTVGVVAGCTTLANMIFNGFVLAYNEHYREQVRAQDKKDFELRNRPRNAGSPQQAAQPQHMQPEGLASVGGMTVHSVSADSVNISINPLEAAQTAATVHAAVNAANNGAWKKEYDPGTKSYYWYNETTKETKWNE